MLGVDPDYRGKGLYRLLFREAVRKAREWNLEGLYVNSDRHLLPEMYERWGAEPYRRIQKSPHGKSPLRAAGVAVRTLARLVAVLAERIARR